MSRKKVLCTILAIAMLISLIGCATATTAPTTTQAPAATTTGAAATTPGATTTTGPTAAKLPLVTTPTTLTYFVELDAARIGVSHASYAEMICFQEMEKLTGVKIDFLHPPAGQALAQLNLLISSQTLPDIAFYGWRGYPGGPDKLVQDNVILKLNDLMDKTSPNLLQMYKENPGVRKDAMTDLGTFYMYPNTLVNPLLTNNGGFVVRTDWLKKLNLTAPETIDEWYAVLTAFRDKDPNGNGQKDEFPIISRYVQNSATGTTVQAFLGAWKVSQDFSVRDGKAIFGPYMPEYKEWLKTMAKWYKEGLIDPDFATTDTTQHDTKILNSIGGVSQQGLGEVATILKNLKDDNAVVGVKQPVLKKGDVPWKVDYVSRPVGGSGAAISAKSKNAELAAKWLDFSGYSKQGYMLLNYGVEGKQYNMVNGYPTLVDDIMKNPTKSVNVALGQYAVGVTSFSFWNDGPVREQRQIAKPMQLAALKTWSINDNSGLFPGTTPSPEESSKLASIMNEVRTYLHERTLAFIMGKADIDAEYDKYIATLKSLGIEDAIKISNDGLARYLKR